VGIGRGLSPRGSRSLWRTTRGTRAAGLHVVLELTEVQRESVATSPSGAGGRRIMER
jgi:hypothetical protein